MKSAPFWDITQRVVVTPYRLLLPISCPETSVRNVLHNIPEERRSHEQYVTNRHSPLSINASEVRLSFFKFQKQDLRYLLKTLQAIALPYIHK
jgi:hypothetical protein